MAQEPRPPSPLGASQRVHGLTLDERQRLRITGVLRVANFDDRQIVLATSLGTLTLSGQDLDIKQLDLEQGDFCVEGLIVSLAYSGGRGREPTKGLMGKLFR